MTPRGSARTAAPDRGAATGRVAAQAAPGGRVGVALLAGFACGAASRSCGASIRPGRGWNSIGPCCTPPSLGVALVAASLAGGRGIERAALGLLAIGVLTALYAIGGKLIPGVSFFGLLDLDHTRDLARLRSPLGYWNALALVCVTAMPVALRLTTDFERRTAGYAWPGLRPPSCC